MRSTRVPDITLRGLLPKHTFCPAQGGMHGALLLLKASLRKTKRSTTMSCTLRTFPEGVVAMSITVTSPQTSKDKETSSGVEMELFRTEVLAEQQSQWLGTVLLIPRVSHAMLAGL